MVLVDTSVWIRFLSNRAPYAARLQALLVADKVIGHELVYGELLIGDTGRRRSILPALTRNVAGLFGGIAARIRRPNRSLTMVLLSTENRPNRRHCSLVLLTTQLLATTASGVRNMPDPSGTTKTRRHKERRPSSLCLCGHF